MSQEYSLTHSQRAPLFSIHFLDLEEKGERALIIPLGGQGPALGHGLSLPFLINPHSHLGMNEPIFQAGTQRSEEMTAFLVWEGMVS